MAIVRIAKPSKWFSKFPRFPSKPKKPPTPPLSPTPKTSSKWSSRGQLQKVFSFFDSNNDGKISCEELRSYFVSVGEPMSYDDVQRVIVEFDANGDGLLEFMEFVKLLGEESNVEDENHDKDDDEIRRAFEVFEVDKGCGCITPKGLKQVLNRLGDEKSDEECEAMIRVFDLDGNGVLDFHEFHKMMT